MSQQMNTLTVGGKDFSAAWYEELEETAGKHGLFIESGIGDPTDIIVSKLVEEREGGGACRGGHKPKKG